MCFGSDSPWAGPPSQPPIAGTPYGKGAFVTIAVCCSHAQPHSPVKPCHLFSGSLMPSHHPTPCFYSPSASGRLSHIFLSSLGTAHRCPLAVLFSDRFQLSTSDPVLSPSSHLFPLGTHSEARSPGQAVLYCHLMGMADLLCSCSLSACPLRDFRA